MESGSPFALSVVGMASIVAVMFVGMQYCGPPVRGSTLRISLTMLHKSDGNQRVNTNVMVRA